MISTLLQALALGLVPIGVLLVTVARTEDWWDPKALAGTLWQPLLVVGLIASLAVHMYVSLGGWPETIGMHGMPAALVLHAEVALGAFGMLLFGSFLALPATLVTASHPRWKAATPSLGLFLAASLLAFVGLQFAPDGFLYWWWD